MRAIFYWLGTDLEKIDGAVIRTFMLADRHDPPATGVRAWLGRLAWRVATRSEADDRAGTPASAPRLPPEADLLARFLATHVDTAAERAAFVLAEFAGLGPVTLAAALGLPTEAVRRHVAALREALLADPEVQARGGPRAVLVASLGCFLADEAWQRRNAAALAAQLGGSPDLSDMLRRPPVILGLGLAAALLLLLWTPPAAPAPTPRRPPPVAVAVPIPPPVVVAPPLPLPVPVVTPAPAPRKVARRGRGTPSKAREALAAREKLAQARDPGAIIVELEMIGAGRKALAANPGQALAYADQHARDYPQSQLVGQRAELRVRALCALGRRNEAKAEADRRGPGKVGDALKQACGL